MSVETQQPVQPAPGAPAPQPAKRRSVLRGWLPLLLAAVVAIGVVVAAVLIFTGGNDKGGGGTVSSNSKADAFNINYPKSWTPLSKDKLATLPGHPLAVIRRQDGKGVVVIRKERGAPPANLTKLGNDLQAQLKKRVPDLKLRTTKTVKIKSGNALFTSYIRKKKGTVQSVVVVPAGKKTFTINTVSRGGANDVAKDIGRMILSFDAKP